MRPYTTHPEAFIAMSTKKVIVIVIVIVSTLSMCSCSTTRTIPIETIKEVTKVDTIYLSNVQYDSIYVYESSSKDYHRGDLKLSEITVYTEQGRSEGRNYLKPLTPSISRMWQPSIATSSCATPSSASR